MDNNFDDYKIIENNFVSSGMKVIDNRNKVIYHIPCMIFGNKNYALGYSINKSDLSPIIKISKITDFSIYNDMDFDKNISVKKPEINNVMDGMEPILAIKFDEDIVLKQMIKRCKILLKIKRKLLRKSKREGR